MKITNPYQIFLILFLCILIFIPIFYLDGPKILYNFESVYYFHSFGSLYNDLNFQISPRANIGDTGHGFADLSRNFLEFFGLNKNLDNVRLITKIYAGLSLVFLFIIIKKFTNKITSLLTIVLIASNPLFFFYSNTMTIIMVSFLGLIILILALINLEKDYSSKTNWILFILSLILISLHYGVGRIIGFLLISYFVFRFLIDNFKKKDFKIKLKVISKNFFISFLVFLLLLTVLNYKNIYYFIRFDEFLLPKTAEGVFMPLYKEYTASLLQTLKVNIKTVFGSISGGLFYNEIFSSKVYDLLLNIRYPISNVFIFIILIFSFVLVIRKKNNKNLLNFYFLFFIFCFPLIFSLVFSDKLENYKEGFTTLSEFRMFFLLIPIHLIVSLCIFFILEKKTKWKKFTNLSVIIIVFFIYYSNIKNINVSNNFLKSEMSEHHSGVTIDDIIKSWSLEKAKDKKNEKALYLLQHFNYNLIANKIKKQCSTLNSREEYCVIKVESKSIGSNLLGLEGLTYINNYNYHNTFLNLYLSNKKIFNSWVQVMNADEKNQVLGLSFGKNRIFSAKTHLLNNEIEYESLENSKFIFRYFDKKVNKVIITTTNSELEYVKNYLEKKNLKYHLFKI